MLQRQTYTLVEALQRLALKGTEWAQAQVDTIRLKLLKIGAVVKITARRVLLEPAHLQTYDGAAASRRRAATHHQAVPEIM